MIAHQPHQPAAGRHAHQRAEQRLPALLAAVPNQRNGQRAHHGHAEDAVGRGFAGDAGPAERHRPKPAVPRSTTSAARSPRTTSHQQPNPSQSEAGLRRAVQAIGPRIGRSKAQKIQFCATCGKLAFTGVRHGKSDIGQTAASSSPTSVPGMVIPSGMIFSSTSISDAASIKANSNTCAANSKCTIVATSARSGNGMPRRQQPGGARLPTSTATPVRRR